MKSGNGFFQAFGMMLLVVIMFGWVTWDSKDYYFFAASIIMLIGMIVFALKYVRPINYAKSSQYKIKNIIISNNGLEIKLEIYDEYDRYHYPVYYKHNDTWVYSEFASKNDTRNSLVEDKHWNNIFKNLDISETELYKQKVEGFNTFTNSNAI